jgi:hypothetical protein
VNGAEDAPLVVQLASSAMEVGMRSGNLRRVLPSIVALCLNIPGLTAANGGPQKTHHPAPH